VILFAVGNENRALYGTFYNSEAFPGWRLGVGLTTLIVEKPPRNSAGFYGGGQGLSWAVGPREEEEEEEEEVLLPILKCQHCQAAVASITI
jgi:hypothetical protein